MKNPSEIVNWIITWRPCGKKKKKKKKEKKRKEIPIPAKPAESHFSSLQYQFGSNSRSKFRWTSPDHGKIMISSIFSFFSFLFPLHNVIRKSRTVDEFSSLDDLNDILWLLILLVRREEIHPLELGNFKVAGRWWRKESLLVWKRRKEGEKKRKRRSIRPNNCPRFQISAP